MAIKIDMPVDALHPGMILIDNVHGHVEVTHVHNFDLFDKNSACDRTHIHVDVKHQHTTRNFCYHYLDKVNVKVADDVDTLWFENMQEQEPVADMAKRIAKEIRENA